MKNLWTRIGLGALGVFLVGMMLITVVRQASSAASSTIASALRSTVTGIARASAPHEMAFRLDGTDLGRIRRLAVSRHRANQLPDLDIEVDLTDAAARGRLASCALVPADKDDFSFERGFRCEGEAAAGYVTVGQAIFSPGDFARPIKVARSMEAHLERGEPFEATAEMGGDVRVVARGKNGGQVRVHADSNGAHIRITDAMGRAVLRLLADSHGAALRVRGKDGRDIVRLEAGEGGFSLAVDTSAAQ